MIEDTVLIIDDDESVRKMLDRVLGDAFSIRTAADGNEGILETERNPLPDLIVLDLNIPEKGGMKIIQELHASGKTKNIPVVFLTGHGEEYTEQKGFEYGAVDFLRKPISPSVLKARIDYHIRTKKQKASLESLVKERTKEIQDTQLEIIYRLGRAAEYKDNETGDHIRRISAFSRDLSHFSGYSENFSELINSASPMHDVGKIGIPDAILTKPGSLTSEEWEVMKSHTVIGAELMSGSPSILLKTAKTIALSHHEKWDGTGYPSGLQGKEIPIEGRIVAICDVYDALTSKRPYKDAWPVGKAKEEIRNNAGIHFDPELTDVFLRYFNQITGSSALKD